MNELGAILVDTADRVFQHAQKHLDGRFDAAVWDLTESAGLDRILLPEDEGGVGDAFPDAVAVAMRLGANAAAIPLIESMVANWVLSHAGLAVPDGPKSIVVASAGELPKLGAGGVLSFGQLLEVPWGSAVRTSVVVAAQEGDCRIVRLDQPLTGDTRTTLAGEPLTLANGHTRTADAVGDWRFDPELPLALLALLKAAAIAGAADSIVSMTIEYANTRTQFGRRIAAFQAIQHMIARMASEAAAAAAAVQRAAHDFGAGNSVFAAAVAKSRASEAAGTIASAAHQVHGAIGFTAEHTLHHFTRRVWTWREDAGNETYWYARLGTAALQADGKTLWSGLVSGFDL
ncbi:MAG: acyl-CoA dehydrogenase family protein [Xanthobacteraceae bacterium]|nr:acyl-CoA dehydrogenase family protein [Xanthobacteraceae bacterium]PWB64537.1 MAG: hypothetical protein C3F17_06675 [Bradyrhizobiaceae bacterium]GIK80525.1 MAG: acyl-CoA dehydrogenase [Alphaproteobacteria bacterium]